MNSNKFTLDGLHRSIFMISDLHFSDKREDEYRFGIFKQVATLIQSTKKYGDNQSVYILGDIVDAKDKHSSKLVNRIVDELGWLSTFVDDIKIIMGNHDRISEGHPYFRFLNYIPNINYIWKPELDRGPFEEKALFLPHSIEPLEYFSQEKAKEFKFGDLDFIFMHQTFHGSISESGQQMAGLPTALPKIMGFNGHIFSGDVHVP